MAQAVQQQPAPETIDQIAALPEGEQLTLDEMSRIMDVATTLRRERARVEHQLNFDEVKSELRRRLLEAAKISGDAVTADEIDVAIDQYYDRLHTFQEPPLSFRTLLAHLYVRRTAIVAWAVGLAAAGAAILTLF